LILLDDLSIYISSYGGLIILPCTEDNMPDRLYCECRICWVKTTFMIRLWH